mgnify:CR=1 FL=1
MEIRYKLYPYPVLAYYSDDYKDGSFDTKFTKITESNLYVIVLCYLCFRKQSLQHQRTERQKQHRFS